MRRCLASNSVACLLKLVGFARGALKWRMPWKISLLKRWMRSPSWSTVGSPRIHSRASVGLQQAGCVLYLHGADNRLERSRDFGCVQRENNFFLESINFLYELGFKYDKLHKSNFNFKHSLVPQNHLTITTQSYRVQYGSNRRRSSPPGLSDKDDKEAWGSLTALFRSLESLHLWLLVSL